ncbi:hypothetical protein GIB67_029907 [Kingdonia uniflora]|uniref:RING-type E3 ubiquitin transferase n=1 Tax=Kingdonia uniflora TaxID=39325 RepID=A0A7J7P5E1_9MAGN|nr:hypothetical protein GIB67_029907 [Kingdonia uniflora]
MRRRHFLNAPQVFEIDRDQNWNDTEQPFIPSGASVIPMETMPIVEVNYASQWNPAWRPHTYSSSSVSMDLPPYRAVTSGPSYDPFFQPPAATSFCPFSQNQLNRQSSSYYGNFIHESGGSSENFVTGHGRGPCKRKSPSIPDAGSSSHSAISSNLQSNMPTSSSQHYSWDPMGMAPSFSGSTRFSITESSERNVRSRSAFDVEANMARTRLSADRVCNLHPTGHLMDHSSTVGQAGLPVATTTREPTHFVSPAARNYFVPHAPRGRISPRDTSCLNHGMEQLLVGSSSSTGSSAGFSVDHRNPVSSRNYFGPPQNLHYPPTQAVIGGQNNYAQRTVSGYRTPLSHSHTRHMEPSLSNGFLPVMEAYSYRQSRPVSSVGWRSGDRIGRSRMSYEIPHLLSDEANAHEGFMMVNRSASFYASREFLDQHRGMRLDTDNMSYEELLALGESIGNVNTGLSEELISKCLIKTLYRSDQIHEEGTCVICLEEYKNKDEFGKLMKCGHCYHVGCIKNWLLVKNVCPICKAPALEDQK